MNALLLSDPFTFHQKALVQNDMVALLVRCLRSPAECGVCVLPAFLTLTLAMMTGSCFVACLPVTGRSCQSGSGPASWLEQHTGMLGHSFCILSEGTSSGPQAQFLVPCVGKPLLNTKRAMENSVQFSLSAECPRLPRLRLCPPILSSTPTPDAGPKPQASCYLFFSPTSLTEGSHLGL